jgi:hypothetical protein
MHNENLHFPSALNCQDLFELLKLITMAEKDFHYERRRLENDRIALEFFDVSRPC